MADDDEFTLSDVFGSNARRPDHPDFWRLSEIILAFEGRSQNNPDDTPQMFKEMASGEYGDMRSMAYMAEQRTLIMLQGAGLPPQIAKALMAVWLEGYIIGSTFQKRGGHQ